VVAAIARSVTIPVFGSGDCIEPEDIVARMRSGVSGVFVGRGVLRNPWILAQARDLMAGRPARQITDEERGQFLLDYMEMLLADEKGEQEGFRHSVIQASSPNRAPGAAAAPGWRPQASKERWVINKLRALCTWYTKGFEGGAQFRIGVNSAKSIAEVEALIASFFLDRTRSGGVTSEKGDEMSS
jgi:tRNA-dihydrouridine synthase